MTQSAPTVVQELLRTDFYHGLLPREDIKALCKEAGDFLVRMSEPSGPGKREFVLSVCTQSEGAVVNSQTLKHFVITRNKECKFQLLDARSFDNITSLVDFYKKESITNAPHPPIILKKTAGQQTWELEHDDIECTKKLGEGAFGEVHKGVLKTKKKNGDTKKVDVAIKLAKLDALTKEQIKEIMREARLMKHFGHPNVVKMYGVAARQEPLMIVMELASDGALDSYLTKNDNLPYDKKAEMTIQSAWGLDHLHESNCLHRDIAARNCLYGKGQVKISDFGLSRIGETYQMNPKNKVPIRWLAPETLKTAAYSRKTDVWAYGVLVWEIFNNGADPYTGMTILEVLKFVKEGNHLDLKDKCDNKEMCELIEKYCWATAPDDRFSIKEIVKELERITGTKGVEMSKNTKALQPLVASKARKEDKTKTDMGPPPDGEASAKKRKDEDKSKMKMEDKVLSEKTERTVSKYTKSKFGEEGVDVEPGQTEELKEEVKKGTKRDKKGGGESTKGCSCPGTPGAKSKNRTNNKKKHHHHQLIS